MIRKSIRLIASRTYVLNYAASSKSLCGRKLSISASVLDQNLIHRTTVAVIPYVSVILSELDDSEWGYNNVDERKRRCRDSESTY